MNHVIDFARRARRRQAGRTLLEVAAAAAPEAGSDEAYFLSQLRAALADGESPPEGYRGTPLRPAASCH